MGNIKFADCQDLRNRKQIVELDCPNCHEPGEIEVFVKDRMTVGDSVCETCGYLLPEGSDLDEE